MAEYRLPNTYKTILLATEQSEFSKTAEEVAIRIAAHLQAKLVAISRMQSHPAIKEETPDRNERAKEGTRLYLEQLLAQAKQAGIIAASMEVCNNTHPHEPILEVAEKINADLIVIGRRGHRSTEMMVGDTVAHVLAKARAAVLIVPIDTVTLQSKILLATDGSRHSLWATEHAILFARAFKLPIHILSVIKTNDDVARRKMARSAVAQATQRAKTVPDITITSALPQGYPPHILVEELQACAADLIVIGSHGHTDATGRVLIGSNADRIIGQATCPVLVATDPQATNWLSSKLFGLFK